MRTLIQARWFVRSNTSANWHKSAGQDIVMILKGVRSSGPDSLLLPQVCVCAATQALHYAQKSKGERGSPCRNEVKYA